jgi:hypothetical protein
LIAYFVLGIALLIGCYLVARWFVVAEPRQVLRIARVVLFIVAILFAGTVIFAGRHILAMLALPALIPFLINLRAMYRRAKSARGPSSGQTSEIATRFFKMRLDHDSGNMSGAILEGRFQGRMLEELSLEQLIELWQETSAEDPQSAAVLEAYLERVHGDAWREGAGGRGGGARSSGAMTREEAYAILGLEPGASPKQVHDAHRQLMQKLHPDRGGSNYLAAKINQAKDLLLGE